jgi:DNA-directed RNA polymerase specialized sigma24 family protein
MEFQYRLNYTELSDKEIVEKILAVPHNEEAAAFLLHNRYDPLLQKVYKLLTEDATWFDDCVDELFMHLKGRDCSWSPLAGFEWRSTLGCWLKGVAKNKFLEVLPKLIENGGFNVSLDNDDSDKPKVQIPDGGEESYERRQRKVMLMEAIGQLKDDDQRFVILKRLEGYNSKEIAILLQKKWHKHGIKKYNNKKELVVPDAAYVDVRTQRAKENLKKIIVVLK